MEPTIKRSAAYHSTMGERRKVLRDELSKIFTGKREFTCEVGCGHGHFLTAYAKANPDKLCLGIDMAGDRIERALRKRNRAGLENLFFVHAEVGLFLDVLPHDVSVNELFILFPDPWPKVRHHKHRVLQTRFLSAVARHTRPNSRLCFRTDFAPYFEAARKAVCANPNWKLSEEPWPFEFTTVFQSRATDYQSFVARSSSNPNTRPP